MRHPIPTPLFAALALGLAAGTAQATLQDQAVSITEAVGSLSFAYGYAGQGSTQTTTATVGTATLELGPHASTPWIVTTLDIDPARQEIAVLMNVGAYGVMLGVEPWTFTLDFAGLTGERFTGVWATNWNSRFATPTASFTDRSITLGLTGGYANLVNPSGTSFWAFYSYGTEPVANVPEPATGLLAAAGLALLPGMRRRRMQR